MRQLKNLFPLESLRDRLRSENVDDERIARDALLTVGVAQLRHSGTVVSVYTVFFPMSRTADGPARELPPAARGCDWDGRHTTVGVQ